MYTYIADRELTWAGPGHGAWTQAQGSPGPGPRPGPGLDQARQPWAWVQAPGLGPTHASALLAIYVCAYSALIYVISFRKITNYSK